MRYAHLPYLRCQILAPAWLVLACALAVPALAAAADSAAPQVTDPAAPTLPLQHLPLPASGSIATEPMDWKAANQAVAQFPRGHADVLQWEKAQAAPQPQTPASPANAHPHHGHGGQP